MNRKKFLALIGIIPAIPVVALLNKRKQVIKGNAVINHVVMEDVELQIDGDVIMNNSIFHKSTFVWKKGKRIGHQASHCSFSECDTHPYNML